MTSHNYACMCACARAARARVMMGKEIDRPGGSPVGKKEIGISTVLNALSPLGNALLTGFKIKILINRPEETIKLLSEAFTAEMFSNMKKDAERVFKRYADVCEQATAVGVETKGLMVGTEAARFLAAAA